jgi:dolichyl-phosphate beta-glucosyltransferase
MSSQPLKLSVVIPAYNEARRLPLALGQIRAHAAAARGWEIEVVVVDDGSRDGTAEAARRFEPGPLKVRVLGGPRNRGKGHAVRQGMLAAEGDLLLMSDADMSTPLGEVEKLLPYLEEGYDVVIGSRDHPESILSPPQGWLRRMMGRTLRFGRRLLVLRDLKDTQCGFKLFTREAGRRIFRLVRTENFAFDFEALLLARRLGYAIAEVGVLWCNDPDSRVHVLRDPVRMLGSLASIRWRLRRLERRADAAAAAKGGPQSRRGKQPYRTSSIE